MKSLGSRQCRLTRAWRGAEPEMTRPPDFENENGATSFWASHSDAKELESMKLEGAVEIRAAMGSYEMQSSPSVLD